MNIQHEDSGLYSCFSIATEEWKNISLIVDEKQIKDGGMGIEDDDEMNFTLDDSDYCKPYFTNYSVMHNSIAKLTAETCILFCPAYGMLFYS